MIDARELPATCRTWDSQQRAWKPKTLYPDRATAAAAAGTTMLPRHCPNCRQWHLRYPRPR